MRIRTAGVAILACLAGVAEMAERPGHARGVQRPAADVVVVLRQVRERVTAAKPGEWVLGKGWDEGRLAERRELLASKTVP